MGTISILCMSQATYLFFTWGILFITTVDMNYTTQKYFFNTSIALFKIKSSSTWLLPASLCEGPFFYFYVESSSSKFMHQLREHSCHSECNVHSPRIIIDWLILLVLLVLKLLVSSHPLNSKGVLAFMFCSTIGDKLSTTFLCFICSNKHVLSMLSIHCHCLSYFSWLEHSC